MLTRRPLLSRDAMVSKLARGWTAHLQSLFARVAPRDARGADRDWACRGRADGHTAGSDRRPRSVCCTLLHCTLVINDMPR